MTAARSRPETLGRAAAPGARLLSRSAETRAAIARADTQQGIRLYDRQRHHRQMQGFGGHDPGVCALGHGAITAWLTGHPAEAERLAEAALALGRELGHPMSHAVGMNQACTALLFRGDTARCRAVADELVELSQRHGLAQLAAQGLIQAGLARVEAGEISSGLKLLAQGLDDYRSLGQRGLLPVLLCYFADACLRASDPESALGLLAEALLMSEQTHQGWLRSEMLRLQADAALVLGRIDPAAARAQLEAAIALAREQSAVALEFRATCSLARLLARSGERANARELVQAGYAAFGEGHETRDLRAGRQLLDELSR